MILSKMRKINSNWILASVAIASFLGFLDASYLTAAHYSGINLACRIVQGCDLVTTSKYSVIGPIPVALIGVVYYITACTVLLSFWVTKKDKFLWLLTTLVAAGFVVSVVFVLLQLFVIHAICLYCMVSATLTTLILVLSLALRKINSSRKVVAA